jgi:flavin-dependent dehydrogenase
MNSKKNDVLIIGGGASGYSTAISLAQTGLKVILVDQEKQTVHKGELLNPKALPLLKKLGCWKKFQQGNHQECPGIISSWGAPEPYEADFINNPYGMGWFVDKSSLQSMFASRLKECGGEVVLTKETILPKNQSAGNWHLKIKELEIHANFLVIATGRSSLPSITQGKIAIDKQVALLRVGSYNSTENNKDMRLQVEATENGWGYLAFYPGGQIIHAFMTDADLLGKSTEEKDALLRNASSYMPHIAKRIENCTFPTSSVVVPANTYLRKQVAGKDWLAVGDAAMATDPLSGYGIVKALRSGIRAAEAITELKQQRSPNLREYAIETMTEFERFVSARTSNYNNEQRWPDAPFWSRRIKIELTTNS